MAFKTYQDLIQDVVASIGEVTGTSVQTYSEPRIRVAISQIFQMIFRKVWWPQYCAWFTLALDGTLGIVTTNELADVKDFRDIQRVIPTGRNKPIPLVPYNVNPATLTGTIPLYYESLPVTSANYNDRKLQFWPKTATGGIVIRARLMPTIADATILYIDDLILVNGAAWMILEDEDINPNAAQSKKDLFDDHFASAVKALADHQIEGPFVNLQSDYINQWQI